MNRTILSANERKKLEAFLSKGIRHRSIHQLFWRIERYLPDIKKDMELVEKAIQKYRSEKRPTGPRPRKQLELQP
jgi:hypothetical protein